MQNLDKAFDILVYTLILTAFLGGGLLIVKSVFDTMKGFYVREMLIDAGILILLATAASVVFIMIKRNTL
jgi:hypothetical protein